MKKLFLGLGAVAAVVTPVVAVVSCGDDAKATTEPVVSSFDATSKALTLTISGNTNEAALTKLIDAKLADLSSVILVDSKVATNNVKVDKATGTMDTSAKIAAEIIRLAEAHSSKAFAKCFTLA